MLPRYRPRVAMLARRLADQAERYEASAREGTPALPFRAAWAVLAPLVGLLLYASLRPLLQRLAKLPTAQ